MSNISAVPCIAKISERSGKMEVEVFDSKRKSVRKKTLSKRIKKVGCFLAKLESKNEVHVIIPEKFKNL